MGIPLGRGRSRSFPTFSSLRCRKKLPQDFGMSLRGSPGSLGQVNPTWEVNPEPSFPMTPVTCCVPNNLGTLRRHQGLGRAARCHLEIWVLTLSSREVVSPGPSPVFRVSEGLEERTPQAVTAPPCPLLQHVAGVTLPTCARSPWSHVRGSPRSC